MEWTLTDEQEELRRSVRRFFEQKSTSADVRRLMETDDGYDPAVWSQMAEQLGLQGLALPEEHGGSGFSFVEQAIVLEEMGRSLLCSPYFGSVVLAGTALVESGDESIQKELLPGIADGSTIATLALAESDGRWSADATTVSARRTNEGYTLSGAKHFVLDGHNANVLLVVARADGGPSLFVVDPTATGVSRRLLETIDMTRKLALIELTDAPARLIGAEGDAERVITSTLQRAAVALAAEQVGAAQRCLDMSVDYAKLRVQFGRPIGSFQAIKHKCADMLLEVESARSAVHYAAWAIAEDTDEVPLVSSVAKAYCSDAFTNAAAENIQIHGGIGFTWEHDAHLYYRRAKSSELLFGTPHEHRDAVAGLLLAAEGK